MDTPHKTERRNSINRLRAILSGTILFSLVVTPVVEIEAAPRQIIILRHGEKQDSYKLTPIGQMRSLALRANYLGKDAASSLFPEGAGPDGIFAITLHTLELVSPAAQSWGLPLQLYSVVPLPGLSKQDEILQLNQRTQQAANALLTDPRWDGKTVVMVWEHDHIAKKKLEEQFPDEKVTLRQLLNLELLPQVPESWDGNNYDYFWIVDYGNPGSAIPTRFTMQKQVFPPPYEVVPSNDWGAPENSFCELFCESDWDNPENSFCKFFCFGTDISESPDTLTSDLTNNDDYILHHH
ncbi:MAG: histidine phosphatase family protein [Candidatus Contendobacter sp.]|nr:histidine phosphatase family protein [Candidatus Contendobacter sp.]